MRPDGPVSTPAPLCTRCGARPVVIDAPVLARDSDGDERWTAARIGYCACGGSALVAVPAGTTRAPDEDHPPGEGETPEGRTWLARLRAALREAPADPERRRDVAAAWLALSPAGRLDAGGALSCAEQAWATLAGDELHASAGQQSADRCHHDAPRAGDAPVDRMRRWRAAHPALAALVDCGVHDELVTRLERLDRALRRAGLTDSAWWSTPRAEMGGRAPRELAAESLEAARAVRALMLRLARGRPEAR